MQIFDQRQLEHFQVIGASNDRGHGRKPEFLRGSPSAFASNEFKACADLPHDERLNDAMLANRIDQFLQRFAPKILARLQRARHYARQINLVDSFARLGPICARGDRRRADQRAKTFTQTGACHASEATGTDLSTQTAIYTTVWCRTSSPAFPTAREPAKKEFLKKSIDILS